MQTTLCGQNVHRRGFKHIKTPNMYTIIAAIGTWLVLTSANTTADMHCPSMCSCKTNDLVPEDQLYHVTCYFWALEDFNPRAFENIQKPFTLTISCDSGVPNELGKGIFRSLSNMRELSLNKCKIRYIHQDAFEGLANLTHLSIISASNLYLQIHPLALQPLENVAVLSLTNNGLTKVPSLCDKQHLVYLNMSNNALSSIKNAGLLCYAPAALSKLKGIDLSRNHLLNLTELKHIGSAFPVVEQIYLSKNQISFSLHEETPFWNLQKLRILYLSHNNITDVHTDLIQFNSAIEDIDLSYNSISYLPERFFAHATFLIHLNLRRNEFDDTVWSRLTNVENLMLLDISYNKLTILNQTIISDLPKLSSLLLENNHIVYIPDRTFQNQQMLKELNLAHNQIHTIDKDAFYGLLYLTELRLEENRIFSINANLLEPLMALKSLNMSSNFISEFPMLDKQTALVELDARNNLLRFLPEKLFNSQTKLEYLDLSENKIVKISDMLFITCSSLKVLDLSNNKIEYVHPAMFAGLSLTTLHLQENKIAAIGSTFANLKGLRELNLSYNDISDTIQRNMFPEAIEMLDLSRNYIEFIRPRAFTGLPQIRLVDIRSNQIRTLSKDSLELSTGQYAQTGFVISDNPLDCDCSLLWLKHWDQTARGSPNIVNLNTTRCTNAFDHPPDVIKNIPDDRFLCRYERMCPDSCSCCDFFACDCQYKCPDNCECFRSSDFHKIHYIKCSERNLTTIEKFLPMISTSLDFSGNDLSIINTHTFFGMKHLIRLYLNDSKISLIQNQSFLGLDSLQYLYLDHNSLRELKKGMFDGIAAVQEIYLDNNAISVIESGVFDGITSLRKLTLAFNQLQFMTDYVSHLVYAVPDLSMFANPWTCNCLLYFSAEKQPTAFVNATDDYRLLSHENIICSEQSSPSNGLIKLIGLKKTCKSTSDDDNINYPKPIIRENSTKTYADSDSNVKDVVNVESSELDLSFFESNLKMLVAFIVVALVIILFIVTAVCRREFVKCWLVTKYKCSAQDERFFYDKTRHYDAFVTYHKHDEVIVVREIVLRLEHGKRKYQLLVQHRDCPIDAPFNHFVENGVLSSHRTIVVLSKETMTDASLQSYIIQCVKRDSIKRLLIILLDRTDEKKLDPVIKSYMKSGYCLYYDDSLFWEKLYLCLPEPGSVARANARADVQPYASSGLTPRLTDTVRDNQAYEEPMGSRSRPLPMVTEYGPGETSQTYCLSNVSDEGSNIYEEITDQSEYGESRRYEEPWKDINFPSCSNAFAHSHQTV